MRLVVPRISIVLTCCLALVLQLPGIASVILACGCILPGRTCCCSSLPLAPTAACCGTAAERTESACCSTPKSGIATTTDGKSSDSPCPCWEKVTDRPAALPSSPRIQHEPDSVWMSHFDAVSDISPIISGQPRTAESHVPTVPRLRLQSLLCVWII